MFLNGRFITVLVSRAKGGIRGMCDRLWICCGDYTFRMFELHLAGYVHSSISSHQLVSVLYQYVCYGHTFCGK